MKITSTQIKLYKMCNVKMMILLSLMSEVLLRVCKYEDLCLDVFQEVYQTICFLVIINWCFLNKIRELPLIEILLHLNIFCNILHLMELKTQYLEMMHYKVKCRDLKRAFGNLMPHYQIQTTFNLISLNCKICSIREK